MLFDLLSTDMYASYNVKLAKTIGLHAAIYISELLNINRKALQKNKVNEEGFFTIDRKYITQRTTFSNEAQIEIEEQLKSLGIIKRGEGANELFINTDNLTGILLDTNEQLVDTITVNAGKKLTKKEAIARSLKTNIVTTNKELIEAYSNWIDAVMTKFGWMSKKAVTEGQSRIDEYSHKDLDLALKLLELAAINGFRDINYAIDLFERRFKKDFEKSFLPVKAPEARTTLSDEVF